MIERILVAKPDKSAAPKKEAVVAWLQTTDTALLLLCSYCFFITLGAFARFSTGISTVGIPSILLVCVIVLKLAAALRMIKKQPILYLWLILLGYIFCVTVFTKGAISYSMYGYRQIGSLLLYIVFAGAVASLKWGEEEVYLLAKFMAAGLVLSASLCIVDTIGLADIPRINDTPSNTDIPYGQFRHRSVMGLYLAVFYSFLFVVADGKKIGAVWRWAVLYSGLYYFWLLIYSRNRSGPAALILAISGYFVFNFKAQRRSLLRKVPDFFLIVVAAVVIFAITDSNLFSRYCFRLLNSPVIRDVVHLVYNPGENTNEHFSEVGKRVHEADMGRVYLAKGAAAQLLTAPYGAGFINDPHVFFAVDIVYAAGFFGVLWIIIATVIGIGIVLKLFRQHHAGNATWAIATGLMGWLLVGAMYNAIYMGIAWALLGVMIRLHDTAVETSTLRKIG